MAEQNKITILDPTLRDGSHAIGHKLSPDDVANYVRLADDAGVDIIEVGHGLGLGASCAQVGISAFNDATLNSAAIAAAKRAKICNFVIPGFATINKDIAPAVEQGVSVFRFGSHCTEANLTKKHIQYVRSVGMEAMSSLIMSHMADEQTLLEQSLLLQDYGATSVTLMDSAGAFTLTETRKKISMLVENLDIAVGYHGHNNIGLSVGNSIVAAQCGAGILDATARGFGAGAGNTPLEAMVAALHKEGFSTNVNLLKVLEASKYAQAHFIKEMPSVSDSGIIGGYFGICGAFQKHVLKAANDFQVSVAEICEELAANKAVAGQEDMIIEIAKKISEQSLG